MAITIENNLVSYETLLETITTQIEETSNRPQLMDQFLTGLKHG